MSCEAFGRVTPLAKNRRSPTTITTTTIVKGLGSFDLDIMFRSPLSQALFCFKQRFRSFQHREYFQADDESFCSDEYLSFLDELRKEMPELDQPRVIITGAVFLFQNRKHYKPVHI